MPTLYGAPWCPDCRRSKKFLGEHRIAYDYVDLEATPEGIEEVLARNDGKRIIPTIVFDDGTFLAEPSNEELAEKLGLSREAAMHAYDVIIIGGGPTGLTTAIYAARENLETLVIERSGLGGQAGVTERLDNYPGFPEGIGGAELADRFVQQARRYEVEILEAVGVEGIAEADDGLLEVKVSTGGHYEAPVVLLATGSSYRRTDVKGEDELIGAGIHFCATCDGPFYKGSKELMVIGGGNSGLEESLFLEQFTEKVVIVEYNDELKASKLLVDEVTEDEQIDVYTGHAVKEFVKDEHGKVGGVIVEERASGKETTFHPQGVFVFIGLDPNAEVVKGQVETDGGGFVMTDDRFMTTIPGVFAAGDVRSASTKQLASAVGEGAAAAIAIRGYLDKLGDRKRA